MSLRRRDLFWQESGGGPGDGDVIVYAAETRTYGVQLSYKSAVIWPKSGNVFQVNYNDTSGSYYEFSENYVLGNVLLSPDGKTVIMPNYSNMYTSSSVTVYGVEGEWSVVPKPDDYTTTEYGEWTPETITGNITVLSSPYIDNGELDEDGNATGSGSAATSSCYITVEQDMKMHVASDGEQNYDYLVVYVNGIETLNLSSSSAKGEIAQALDTNVIELSSGSEVKLEYRKDSSNSDYSDRAYMYLEKYPTESVGTKDSASFVGNSWIVYGSLDGSTLFSSNIAGQQSATASAYFKLSASKAPETVTLLARSNGESGYDYLTVYELDSTSSVAKSFRNSASAAVYTTMSFVLTDTAEHEIHFNYRKDGNQDSNEDAAFVCLVGYSASVGSGTRVNMSSTRTAWKYSTTSGVKVGVNRLTIGDSGKIRFEKLHWFETTSYYSYATGSARSILPNSLKFVESGKLNAEGYIYTGNKNSASLGFYGTVNLTDDSASILVGSSSNVSSAIRLSTFAKYSDDGNVVAILPLTSSTSNWTVQRLSESASAFLKILKADYDESSNLIRYVETSAINLLPANTGSVVVPVDTAFSKNGKTSYMLATTVQAVASSIVYTPRLYRSTNAVESYELLDWNPGGDSTSEYIVGVCTNFSGRVVYALTATCTGSYSAYRTASLYRSVDRGNTFYLCSTHSIYFPSPRQYNTSYLYTGSAIQRVLDIRYRPQVACSGKGDKVALCLGSTSRDSGNLQYVTSSLYRSEDFGVSWPYSTVLSSSNGYAATQRFPSVLRMNRN